MSFDLRIETEKEEEERNKFTSIERFNIYYKNITQYSIAIILRLKYGDGQEII